MTRPHRHLNPWGHLLKVTARRWYPLLLLRDALGRFVTLRQAPAGKPCPVSRPRPRVHLDAVQLALF